MMREIFILILFGTMIACGPKGAVVCADDDLECKKNLLSEKKTALRDLEKEVKQLKRDILKLNPPKAKAPAPVETLVVKPIEFKRFIETPGRVTADEIVNVSSETGGRIISLNVREGQYVNKGQLIAVTDMTTAENQIEELKTSLDLATTVYEKQKRLWDQNIGSELQYLEAKNNKERLERSMTTLRSTTGKKNIYAPASGVVDREYMSQGEMASPGMPIVQILNTGKLKIVADLQESLLGSIKQGDMVEVYFPSLDKTIKKKVSMIGRTIDPANRTFKIEMNTGSMSGTLKPNLMAQIRMNDFTEKSAIVVPLGIIQEDIAGNKFIYKVKKEGDIQKAERTLIEIGQTSKEGVIVLIGLKSGDEVITSGGIKLKDNDPIETIRKTEANG